ncbi:MAG: hypothetical protein MPJ25_04435 [Pirellulales bacterium]|nr:hypothetical protein [Pirellulales bacterium]
MRDVVNGLSKSIKKSPTETTLAPNIDAFDRILKSLDKTIEGLEKEGKKYKGVLGVGIPPTVPINIAIGGLKVLRAGVAAGKSIKVLINQVHRKFKDYLNKEDTKQFVEDYVDAASRPKDKLRELHGFIDVSNAIEAKVNEKGKQWTKFVTDEKYTGKPFNKREAGRAVASTFVGLESLELTNAVITIGRKASPRLESVFYKEEIAKGTPVQKAKDRAEDKAKSKWWYIGEGYVSALVDKGIVDYDKPSWNPEDPNLIYVLDDDAFNLFIAGSGISLADKPSWSKTSEKPIEKVDGMYYKEKGPDGERLSVIARPTEFQKQVLKAQGKKGKVVQFINKANSQHYDTDTEALDIIEDLFLEGEETFNLKDKNYDTKQLALEQKKIRNAIRGIRDAGGNGYYIHHVASGHGRLLMKVLDNNPQRDKLTRGVTTSRKKEKLGKDGMDVLFAKYSDAHGEGGPSFEERAKFGRSREKEIIEIGSDPRNDRRWIKPGSIEGSVARLAAILEINRALESGNPETFESGVFYLEDVTNSGYQNSAFLTKDPVLGRYTNIIASTIREDLAIPTAAPVFNSFKSPTEEQLKVMDRVHKEIVDLEDKISVATSKAKEDEARGNFINYKGENLADVTTYNEAFWGRPEAKNEMRDVVKHILTAKMYGASVDAAGRNLVNILKTDPTFSNITEENAWFLAQKIFQSFDNKFPKADKLLKGLRSATQEVLKTGNSPAFINDFGFPVQISHYGARNVINTKAKYTGKNKERMGEYVTGSLWSGKGEILWDETVRSGPAIIIQSFEAEIVERLYLKADYPLITIYDNLGTTAANVAKMRQDVKDILVDMFEGNTLERTMDKIVGVDANGKKISDKIMSNIPIGEYKIKDEIYGTEFNITGGKIDKEFLLKRYSQDNTEQLKSSEQVSDIKEGVLVKDSRNMKEISKPCK